MEPILTAIAITLGSYHFDREVERNEFNPGVIVELNHHVIAGLYRNSFSRTTALVGGRADFLEIGSVNVGGFLGVCTGYRRPVCGGISGSYAGFVLTAIPPTADDDSGAIALTYRIQLK